MVLPEKAFTEVVCLCLQLYKEVSLQVSRLKFQAEVLHKDLAASQNTPLIAFDHRLPMKGL
jgi:hypothetical protein